MLRLIGHVVQSVEFIRAHAKGNGNGSPSTGLRDGKAQADISIYGQESNYTTWRLAKMNLAIRGIDGQIAHGDTRTLDSMTSTSSVKQDWERSCLV